MKNLRAYFNKGLALRYSEGFTIVEMLIVVALLGIFATVLFSAYTLTQQTARDGRRKLDLEKLRQALELYRVDTQGYPGSSTNWVNVSDTQGPLQALVPNYIDTLPKDPRDAVITTPYRYKATDVVLGKYYGYCIEANLEVAPTDTNPCAPETGYNYTGKNP